MLVGDDVTRFIDDETASDRVDGTRLHLPTKKIHYLVRGSRSRSRPGYGAGSSRAFRIDADHRRLNPLCERGERLYAARLSHDRAASNGENRPHEQKSN